MLRTEIGYYFNYKLGRNRVTKKGAHFIVFLRLHCLAGSPILDGSLITAFAKKNSNGLRHTRFESNPIDMHVINIYKVSFSSLHLQVDSWRGSEEGKKMKAAQIFTCYEWLAERQWPLNNYHFTWVARWNGRPRVVNRGTRPAAKFHVLKFRFRPTQFMLQPSARVGTTSSSTLARHSVVFPCTRRRFTPRSACHCITVQIHTWRWQMTLNIFFQNEWSLHFCDRQSHLQCFLLIKNNLQFIDDDKS